jgi:oxygen-independent coproporphyrinogen-3 oxidase
VRGLALTRDDLVRRAVIMAMMCQGRVEFESIELAHLICVPTRCASASPASSDAAQAGGRSATLRPWTKR